MGAFRDEDAALRARFARVAALATQRVEAAAQPHLAAFGRQAARRITISIAAAAGGLLWLGLALGWGWRLSHELPSLFDALRRGASHHFSHGGMLFFWLWGSALLFLLGPRFLRHAGEAIAQRSLFAPIDEPGTDLHRAIERIEGRDLLREGARAQWAAEARAHWLAWAAILTFGMSVLSSLVFSLVLGFRDNDQFLTYNEHWIYMSALFGLLPGLAALGVAWRQAARLAAHPPDPYASWLSQLAPVLGAWVVVSGLGLLVGGLCFSMREIEVGMVLGGAGVLWLLVMGWWKGQALRRAAEVYVGFF